MVNETIYRKHLEAQQWAATALERARRTGSSAQRRTA